MNYACDMCNYVTYDISNWKRHLETKKHKKRLIILDHDNQKKTEKSPEKSKKVRQKINQCCEIKEKSNIRNQQKIESAESTRPNVINAKVIEPSIFEKVIDPTIILPNDLFKPLEKFSNPMNCRYCNTAFKDKSNLRRHETTRCTVKQEEERNRQSVMELYQKRVMEECEKKIREEYEKKDLIRQLNDAKMQMELFAKEKEQQIAILTEDKAYFKAVNQTSSATINNSMSTINNSVNALTYLTAHFKKAPELKKLTQDNAKQMLMYEKRLYDYLLFSNAEKKLDQYVGDIILKHIQKEDPENQAVWNSDVSRLTYLVRKLVGDQHIWERDAKGEIFSKYVITPITDYLEKYLNDCLNTEMLKPIETLFDQDEKMRKQGSILDTLRTIKKKKFKRAILLHIAPHVSFKIKPT